MKKELTILILILIIFGLMISFKTCNKTEYITEIDTIEIVKYKDSFRIDTIVIPEYQIINKYITITDTDTIYLFDTIKETIFKYHAKNVYIDTIFNSDSVFLVVSDTINKNLIKHRKTQIWLYNKTKFEVEKNRLFIGSQITLKENPVINLNLSFQKKKNVYSIGYDTDKNLMFGYKYMIK